VTGSNPSATQKTVAAARGFRRRTFLALGAAAVGAAAGGARLIGGRPQRELSLLSWPDELPDPVLANFERTTGIKVRSTPISHSEEQLPALLATGGAGFDLCQAPRDRAPQFRDTGLLAAFDLDRLPNSRNLIPSLCAGSKSVWSWGGGLHHLPHCWGTEGIAWRADRTSLDYRSLSFGTLWDEQYRGAVQGRPDGLLRAIGLWMDRIGRLPSNRMLDAYESEDSMKRIYDVILAFAIDHRAWIGQFCDGAESVAAGFIENDCTIGKTWDGPALSLSRAGKPVGYMAPQEGAITWVDGWTITKAAKNVEEAYEFLNYLMTAEVSAQIAEGSGYNPVVFGADAHLSEGSRSRFAAAYPEDALRKLWHRPPEPSWFAALRLQYARKFVAAVREA
jgi:spermidine/putrescine transport system substrate-binding protein